MSQIELFEAATTTNPQVSKVVNVASVPQRSPFRYAGGKTWLVPKVRLWLSAYGGSSKELIEPFAGGGIVSLTAAFENLVGHVTMVEKDEDVAAVWRLILNGGGEWLANQIIAFDFTPETAREAINNAAISLEARAFATIVKNRANRGGILAKGASFIKNGEKGKGITSRWYPETLRKRILAITQIKDKITFIEGDAFDVFAENSDRKDAVYFIDPPYTKAGRRLYRYSDLNHENLFNVSENLKGEFLMTYNNANEVREMAARRSFVMKAVAMKNTHHAEKKELLICRCLDWIID